MVDLRITVHVTSTLIYLCETQFNLVSPMVDLRITVHVTSTLIYLCETQFNLVLPMVDLRITVHVTSTLCPTLTEQTNFNKIIIIINNISKKDNILIKDALFQFIFRISMKLWHHRCWFTLLDAVTLVPQQASVLTADDSTYIGFYYPLTFPHWKYYTLTLHNFAWCWQYEKKKKFLL